MPKSAVSLTKFDKGLNDKFSSKDLEAGFLSEAINIDVSEKGKLSSLGSFVDLGASLTVASVTDFEPGYGLFSFRTDVGPESGDSAGEYLVYTDGSGAVKISNNNALAAFNSSDLGSNNTNNYPVYYYAEGGLRISDANFSNTGNKQIGVIRIERTGTPYDDIADAMYDYTGGFAVPADADIDALSTTVVDPDSEEAGTLPTADIKVEMQAAGTNGLFPASDYSIGITYVYYGGQESLISDVLGIQTLTDGQAIQLSVSIGDIGHDTNGKFRQGMRIYLRDVNNPDADYTLLLDIDFEQGSRISLSDPFDALVEEATDAGTNVNEGAEFSNSDTTLTVQDGTQFAVNNVIKIDNEKMLVTAISTHNLTVTRGYAGTTAAAHDDGSDVYKIHLVTSDSRQTNATSSNAIAYEIVSPNLDTYSLINGYDPEEKEISFNGDASYSYKTGVVANQRTFVGNVLYKDSEGKTKAMGDRIQYTPIRKYDIFPQSYYLDIGTNDGDEIVKIIENYDELLVFKKKTLYVINIESGSDASWYVSGIFNDRGVSNPGAVCKCDDGIYFANKFGLFSYGVRRAGSSVADIALRVPRVSENIKDSNWASDMGDDALTTLVGYISNKNQIIVVGQSDAADSVGYLYDVGTDSLVSVNTSSVLFNQNLSNFVIYNQELVSMTKNSSAALAKRYLDTAVANTINLKTKQFDFDQPSVDKRFYSVFITYSQGGSVVLKGGLDGASMTDIFTGSGNENLLDNSSYVTEEFVIDSSNRAGKSLQLELSGACHADFEVHDITVIARAKGQR